MTRAAQTPFPYPIHFIHRQLADWPELSDPKNLLDPERCPARFVSGRDCWITRTYLHLLSRGLPVDLRGEFVPGEINVVYYDDLLLKARPDRAFIVAIQPDRPRAVAAEARIVQNPMQVQGSADYFMIHWPQPGLQPRDPARGMRLERIGYIGLAQYLAPEFRDETFGRRLGELGMELVIREKDWTDYRDLDAVLAVRKVSAFDLSIKPPSKLINAWRAGCPALLGAEPAYQHLRRSPMDYFEVRNSEEAIAGLVRLREEPGLMERMIENGKGRAAAEFSLEKLCDDWEKLLGGVELTSAYERWKSGAPIFRAVRYGWRALAHKRARRKFLELIRMD